MDNRPRMNHHRAANQYVDPNKYGPARVTIGPMPRYHWHVYGIPVEDIKDFRHIPGTIDYIPQLQVYQYPSNPYAGPSYPRVPSPYYCHPLCGGVPTANGGYRHAYVNPLLYNGHPYTTYNGSLRPPTNYYRTTGSAHFQAQPPPYTGSGTTVYTRNPYTDIYPAQGRTKFVRDPMGYGRPTANGAPNVAPLPVPYKVSDLMKVTACVYYICIHSPTAEPHVTC